MGIEGQLEAAIVAIVDARIARVLGSAPGAIYSTAPGMWPPGARSRRAARDRIRAVPGHGHAERGVWTVDRAAYHAHHGRRPAELRLVAADDELIERAIARAAR